MKRKLLVTMLGMAFIMIMMITVTQVSHAEDSGITDTYKNVSSIDPAFLDMLSDDELYRGFVLGDDSYLDQLMSRLGDELMYYGIILKKPWGDYMAQQWHLVAID